MRLLVVEDEAVSAAVLSAIARDLGHDVMVAPDAARALELVRDADVVLGDWFLPDLSGPELCARIQAESERFVPFVYVSAQADRDHQLRGMRAGAIGYLEKPVNAHDLAIQLLGAERVLALHRELEEQRRQLRAQVDRLWVEARRDHATGLANRASFEEDVEAHHATAAARGKPYALAMIDLDRFKAYNDTLGHPAGDAALRRVATVLASELRSTDRLYRYGGDELVAVLPTPDGDTALRVLARLRARLAAEAIPHPTAAALTFSAGVAILDPTRPVGWRDLLERADRALYEAKQAGRDRARLAEPDLIVRLAAPAEVEVCRLIRRAVFVEEQGIDPAIEADAHDGSAVHLIALRRGAPIGTARLRQIGDVAKAERVAVLPAGRRQGVGEALMRALEREAAASGASAVVLHAQDDAVPFYEALGYRAEGEPFVEAGVLHRAMRAPMRRA